MREAKAMRPLFWAEYDSDEDDDEDGFADAPSSNGGAK